MGDMLGADKMLTPLSSEKPLTNYQLSVFLADINYEIANYQNAYKNYQNAVGLSKNVSVFDQFYVYFQLSKSAELLQKNSEFMVYAVLADSVIQSRSSNVFNSELSYTLKINPIPQFLDSLKDEATLNLGIAYRKNGYYLTALDVFNKLIIKEKTKSLTSSKLGEFYLNKGLTLILMEKYGEASIALKDALKIFFDRNNNVKISETYNLLAKNSLLKQDYGKVIEQCNESIEYAKQSSDLQNLAAAYLILSENYAANNDYNNSQKYYKLYVSTKESYDKMLIAKTNSYNQKQAETKIILQKVESDIIEREMREMELLNALMIANQKEQENIFLKQENELREKDLINKQLEKEQIQRNLLLMKEQLENEQLRIKYIQEQTEKERQLSENNENKNKLELLNTQKEASDKQNKLNTLELKATKNRQVMFIVIMIIMVLFIAFMVYFIVKFRKQNKIIESNNLVINKTNEELVSTIEQVNIQKALIETKNEEITDSIAYAKRIQNAILPHDAMVHQYLGDNFVMYRPKDIVAGDFYWLSVEDDDVLFAVADCTGHGVPGAMVSIVCHAALTRAVREFKLTQPAAILDKVRDLVTENFDRSGEGVNDGMDIALCHLHKKSKVLKFAGANNGIYIVRKKHLIEIKPDKQPIGKFTNPKPFTHQEIQLEDDDLLYVFSDGYADQFGGEKGKKLKSQTLKEMLVQNCEKTMNEQKKFLENAFDQWRGELEQIDDVCIIGVRV